MTTEKESDKKREQIIEIYQKTLVAIAAMRLKNIKVNLDCRLDGDKLWFYITVFDKYSNNVSYNLYDFQNIEDMKNVAAVAIKEIKTDDFSMIKSNIY